MNEYTRNYQKLFSKTTRPFRVITATEETFVIDEDDVENLVSIDRVTRVSRRPIRTTPVPRSTASPDIDPEGPYADEVASSQALTPDNTDRTAIVDRLVGHEHRPDESDYRVRWFG